MVLFSKREKSKKPTILVFDDDPNSLQTLSMAVDVLNFDAKKILVDSEGNVFDEDGQLNELGRISDLLAEYKPQGIVMDYAMKKFTALQLIEAIRGCEGYASLPVVIATSMGAELVEDIIADQKLEGVAAVDKNDNRFQIMSVFREVLGAGNSGLAP